MAATHAIPKEHLMEMVRMAGLAPSGHNTQPWHIRYVDDTIRILPDWSRRLPVVDADDHALYISLGCAVENLCIAAQHLGYTTSVSFFPTAEPEGCIQTKLTHNPDLQSSTDPSLFEAIPRRQTNRKQYDRRPLSESDLQQLQCVPMPDGIQAILLTDPQTMEPLLPVIEEATRNQFSDAAFREELVRWIRFSRKEVLSHHDGLVAQAMGLPNVPRKLGEWIMQRFATAKTEPARMVRMARSASAMAVFTAAHHDRTHWVRLGMGFERFALKATTLGIAHAHMNMPCEDTAMRAKLATAIGQPENVPLLLLRLGYAEPMPHSPRRPLETFAE